MLPFSQTERKHGLLHHRWAACAKKLHREHYNAWIYYKTLSDGTAFVLGAGMFLVGALMLRWAPVYTEIVYAGLVALCLLYYGVVVYFYSCGVRMALKYLRGEQVTSCDYYVAGPRFFRVLLVSALLMPLVALSALPVVPGVLLLGLTTAVIPCLLERQMGVLESIRLSYQLTRPHLRQTLICNWPLYLMLLFTLFPGGYLLHQIQEVGSPWFSLWRGIFITGWFFTVPFVNAPAANIRSAVMYVDLCYGLDAYTQVPSPARNGLPEYLPPPYQPSGTPSDDTGQR